MPNNGIFQVGLTGGLGSGKSTVARIFSVLGVPVYESDFWAKKLYFLPEVKSEIIKILGEKAYLSEKEIDSQWIAQAIYGKDALREKLNAVLHPAVGRHYQTWIENQKHPYILKVAALVFEANIHLKMDFNLLVTSPLELRKSRVLLRDPNRNLQQVEKIIEAQWTDESKRRLADGEILNDEKQSILNQVLYWNNLILSKL